MTLGPPVSFADLVEGREYLFWTDHNHGAFVAGELVPGWSGARYVVRAANHGSMWSLYPQWFSLHPLDARGDAFREVLE